MTDSDICESEHILMVETRAPSCYTSPTGQCGALYKYHLRQNAQEPYEQEQPAS